jgi:XTP/dITP diphosphohydrolase
MPPTRFKLLLATNNQGKIREYRTLLAGLPVDIITLQEAGVTTPVDETAATIPDNAILKATEYARLTGLLTLADDSGLEVDALNGEPGVKSARYAGEHASDIERNELLLKNMAKVPDNKRQARFRCVIAIAGPGVPVQTAEGTCEGRIARESVGRTGFGYDPIFIVEGMSRHMAELTMEEKNAISHRGKAAAKAKKIVESLIKNR